MLIDELPCPGASAISGRELWFELSAGCMMMHDEAAEDIATRVDARYPLPE
jgi:hypothetical protein